MLSAVGAEVENIERPPGVLRNGRRADNPVRRYAFLRHDGFYSESQLVVGVEVRDNSVERVRAVSDGRVVESVGEDDDGVANDADTFVAAVGRRVGFGFRVEEHQLLSSHWVGPERAGELFEFVFFIVE